MPATTRSRRQTLGVVSNTAKSRDSLGPNARPIQPPNSAARGKPRKSRVSMIPRMTGPENMVPPSPGLTAPTQASRQKAAARGDRRKTMANDALGGSNVSPTRTGLPLVGPNGVRNDPRPMHDKAFQQECTKKLLNFLVKNGYEYPVSLKSLSRPSSKDFNNIVTFLLRLIDPSFQETSSSKEAMKMEDEVAMNFRALGYPFPISKTALYAAGSPHTWPTLLAALVWLTELLEIVQEDVDEEVIIEDARPFQSLEELEITTDKVFFSYLEQSYSAFLRGDEELQRQLEQALVDRFDQDDAYIEQEIDRITDLNAAMVEKMNDLVEESAALPKMKKQRDDYATDLEQFHDLNNQLDDHIAALQQKVKERSEELETTNNTLETKNQKVDKLKQALERQAASLGDIYKLQSELKGVDEAMERASTLKEKLRNAKWDGDDELTNLVTELELAVSDFNQAIAEISLLPGMDESVSALKVTVDKNMALDKNQSKLLGVDLESVVHPTLLRYKEMFSTRTADAGQNYQKALDDLETNEGLLEETKEKLRLLETKKAKLEETLESVRKTEEAKLAVREREVQAIESSVKSINDPVELEEQLARYERKCAELEALRLKQQEENLAKKKAVEDEIEAACQAIFELETFCKAKTAEVHDYWLMKMTICSGSVQSNEA